MVKGKAGIILSEAAWVQQRRILTRSFQNLKCMSGLSTRQFGTRHEADIASCVSSLLLYCR